MYILIYCSKIQPGMIYISQSTVFCIRARFEFNDDSTSVTLFLLEYSVLRPDITMKLWKVLFILITCNI